MRVLDGPRQLRDGGIVHAAMTDFREFGLQGCPSYSLPEPGDRPEEAYLCPRPSGAHTTILHQAE